LRPSKLKNLNKQTGVLINGEKITIANQYRSQNNSGIDHSGASNQGPAHIYSSGGGIPKKSAINVIRKNGALGDGISPPRKALYDHNEL